MFTVSFETDGAAFRSEDTSTHTATRTEHFDAACEEVAHLLDVMARKVREGWRGGPVVDTNGHTVGTWELNLDAIDTELGIIA